MKRRTVFGGWSVVLGFGLGACGPKASSAPGASAPASGDPCGELAMIDDAEDGDNRVRVQEGRDGYAYTYVDRLGSTIEPAEGTYWPKDGGAHGSSKTHHFKGELTRTGGDAYAGFGVLFVQPESPYDASRYLGISFYAKAAPGSTPWVRVQVPDQNTNPHGKICQDCYNDFGMDAELTTDWRRYVIPFSAMKQLEGWGSPRPEKLDLTRVYGVKFGVAQPGVKFDFWIDSLSFVCEIPK